MNRLLVLAMGIALTAASAVACGGEAARAARDSDAVALDSLSRQALERAELELPDAVLRQLDLRDVDGPLFFRFTNRDAERGVNLHLENPESDPERWVVSTVEVSPLLGHPSPGISLSGLRAGPQRVVRGMRDAWPGCTVRSISLHGTDGDLVWYGFCNLPEGGMSGTLWDRASDPAPGEFEPSLAPPARVPVTATPAVSGEGE